MKKVSVKYVNMFAELNNFAYTHTHTHTQGL
jgi:hypothetical protein